MEINLVQYSGIFFINKAFFKKFYKQLLVASKVNDTRG